MEGSPHNAMGEPQHQTARTASTARTARKQGRLVENRGSSSNAVWMDWLSGRLGMLGEAVNNWGQGTLDLDQVGSGPWAGDPLRLQVLYAAGAWL